jgi:hypothetical protein
VRAQAFALAVRADVEVARRCACSCGGRAGHLEHVEVLEGASSRRTLRASSTLRGTKRLSSGCFQTSVIAYQ